MPTYNLNRLGSDEFEKLVQSLVKAVVGDGSITFGPGPDGGREAIFEGRASAYPSEGDPWTGKWIFQAKFHDINRIGPDKARALVVTELENELDKIVNKYGRECDNYIFATNTPLTAVHESGTLDRIANEIIPKYRNIEHIHVWGADDICRMLEHHDGVRTAFLEFILPGDVLAALMGRELQPRNKVAQALRLYLTTLFRREADAQLDQAGEVGEQPVQLQKIFIDTDCEVENRPFNLAGLSAEAASFLREQLNGGDNRRLSVLNLLLSNRFSRVVLIGGPGEGKSTIGQYLAQIHRGALLGRLKDLKPNGFTPVFPRLPLRVALKDYAQWLTKETLLSDSLESFVCEDIEIVSGRKLSEADFQEFLSQNPILLILDGLDEVMDQDLRSRMLDRIGEFLDRCSKVLLSDIQVLATSRPTAYTGQFDPAQYVHLTLTRLDPAQVRDYVTKWIEARTLDRSKAARLTHSIEECLDDPQISLLTNTPLQVTILILIILAGGTPPRQREALFNDYLDVIYKREKAKSPLLLRTEPQLLFGLHQFVAYLLHRDSVGAKATGAYLSQDSYEEAVLRFLRFNDPYSGEDELKTQVEEICREAGERFVLIVEGRPGLWGFELRSIQEFFAACHLADTSERSEQRYERFDAIARHALWRNVSLFLAGRVGRRYSGEAANLLEVCKAIDDSGPDVFARRGCWLALEIAGDRAFGPNRRLQRSVIEYALQLLRLPRAKDDAGAITQQLRKLPVEDLHDHVIPILRRNVEELAPPKVVPSIDVLHDLLPSDPAVLQGLESLSQSGELTDRLDGISRGISFKAPVEMVGRWIRDVHRKEWSRETTSLLGDLFVDQPGYFLESLAATDVPDDILSPLLDFTLDNWWRLSETFDHSGTEPRAYNPDNLKSQHEDAFLVVQCVRLLADLVNEFTYRWSVGGDEHRKPSLGDVLLSQLSRLFGSDRIVKAIADPINDLPTRWSRNVYLVGCIWIFHSLLAEVTPQSARALQNALEALPESMVAFVRRLAYEMSPVLHLVCGERELVTSLDKNVSVTLLERFGGRNGRTALKNAFDEFYVDSSLTSDRSVALFSAVGAHFLSSDEEKKRVATTFESIFGVKSYWAPLLEWRHGESRPSVDEFSVEETSVILESLLKKFDTGSPHITDYWYLSRVLRSPLPDDSRIGKLLLHLGRLAIEELPGRNEDSSQLICDITLALIVDFGYRGEEVRDLLKALAAGDGERRASTPYFFGSKRSASLISPLSELVAAETGTARRGGALLLRSVIGSFTRVRGHRDVLQREDIGTVIDWRTHLMEDDSVVRGLSLELAALELSPKDDDFRLLLDSYDQLEGSEDRKAWWDAVSAIVDSSSREQSEGWIMDVIERHNRGGDEFLSRRLASVLSRLLGSQLPEVNEREESLGLPLPQSIGAY